MSRFWTAAKRFSSQWMLPLVILFTPDAPLACSDLFFYNGLKSTVIALQCFCMAMVKYARLLVTRHRGVHEHHLLHIAIEE